MDPSSTIPIFPLPNAVPFPGVPLPLHISEPRHREQARCFGYYVRSTVNAGYPGYALDRVTVYNEVWKHQLRKEV